jgi:hypothetical protein
VNNIEIKKLDDQSIGLRFEYLDYNQGFVVSIYHSGSYSDIEISGTFVGATKITKGVKHEAALTENFFTLFNPMTNLTDSKNWLRKICGYLIFVLILFVLIPVFIFTAFLDLVNDKILTKKQPKEFLFKE